MLGPRAYKDFDCMLRDFVFGGTQMAGLFVIVPVVKLKNFLVAGEGKKTDM